MGNNFFNFSLRVINTDIVPTKSVFKKLIVYLYWFHKSDLDLLVFLLC